MMRLIPIFLGFLLLVGHGATAFAASAKATALRQANGRPLSPRPKNSWLKISWPTK